MDIYIKTLGCPKNFYDTETVSKMLSDAGHRMVDGPEEADAVIVNTCGFIEDAKRESIDAIFDMASYGKKLIVSGCLAQRYAAELADEMPEVDAFFGVNDYESLPVYLEERDAQKVNVSPCGQHELPFLERASSDDMHTATLKIAEGCDNRCAYCIIPEIRGGYRSKSMENVIREAEWLAEKGCRELILIAQDTTYYGMDLYGKYMLAGLLKKLCRIDGIRWIRIMYAYEDRITDELIETIKNEEKICNYLDIPLQHVSDRVLSSMGRRSTYKSVNGTIGRLRAEIPDIAIRTTFITGFPGETEDDFDELYDFVETKKLERVGVFPYSAEEGTRAAEMPGQIDEETKQDRADSLMRAQMDISGERNRSLIGKTMEVIIDEKDGDGVYIGRTRYDAPDVDCGVIVRSHKDLHNGDIVNIVVTDGFDYDITGEMTDELTE